MPATVVNAPLDLERLKLAHGIFEEFRHYVDADDWTLTASDAGTAADADEVGGVVTVNASDATEADNDEAYLHTTHELFKFASGKPIVAGARVQFSEANTDDANVAFGVKDAVAADSIQDDGAGPPASYHGALIYKLDGETKWRCELSMGASQKTNLSSTTAGGSDYQALEIKIAVAPDFSDYVEATYFVDGEQLVDDETGDPIKHRLEISSATEMALFAGVKNGGANGETLKVDYAYAYQNR